MRATIARLLKMLLIKCRKSKSRWSRKSSPLVVILPKPGRQA